MEERKFIRLKKEEFGIKEFIKRDLGKGKISKLDIEYTPVGEKIIIATSKPGLVIGKRGEKIEMLTRVLKTRFKLENPHIEIKEIEYPLFDAQIVADDLALALERMGNLKFKVIAYRKLQEIMNAGALGCEIRLTGKLPSERARSWRFAQGYLKKAGESRKEIDRAKAIALTKTGIIGIKVAIMNPKARIYDRIEINDDIKRMIKSPAGEKETEEDAEKKPKKKKASKKADTDSPLKDEASQASEESKSGADSKDLKINKKTENTVKPTEDKQGQASKDMPSSTDTKVNEKKISKEEKKEIEGEIKELEKSQEILPERDGTAMKIEEEIEEGVPQDVIDEEIKEDIEKAEEAKNIINTKQDKAGQVGEESFQSEDLEVNKDKLEEQKDNKDKTASMEEEK